MSQVELAEKLDLSQHQVSRYETGTAYPSLPTLSDMAKLFNTSTDYLLGLTNSPHSFDPELPPTQADMLNLMNTQSEATQRKFVEIVRLLAELKDED